MVPGKLCARLNWHIPVKKKRKNGDRQKAPLLEEINRFYILMLDGDEAGEKATIKISNKMVQTGLTFKTVYLIEVKCYPED
jgi:hypothetical protein